MAKNKTLSNAKNAKKDEFYTQLDDIERELMHYRQHFRGKTVLCNCDDPFESNFFQYFTLNFNRLGLKKLIATSYATSPVQGSQLRIEEGGQLSFAADDKPGPSLTDKRPYKAVVTSVHDATGNGGVELEDIANLFKSGENELTELEGNGDFRSEECLELLDEADIVCTNPPFSLFREYVATLMEHEKKFIIIGNQNAITYKEIFPLLKDNKMWIGYRFNQRVNGKNMTFRVPDDYPLSGTEVFVGDDGYKYVSVSGTGWFTNLDITKRHEEMILIKHYDPALYPKYDNYDAINVDKTADIPCDYAGTMGVPITFLDKYCPEQFEILGTDSPYYVDKLGIQRVGEKWVSDYKKIGGTGHITANMHSLCYYENGKAKNAFKRILIRNKHPEQPKEENL